MSRMLEKDTTAESVATTREMEPQDSRAKDFERDEKIRSRAYERYLERGQENGQ